jgi:hypothetical protein
MMFVSTTDKQETTPLALNSKYQRTQKKMGECKRKKSTSPQPMGVGTHHPPTYETGFFTP